MHCRKMAATAPQFLAVEFERLAQKWAQLADDLEQSNFIEDRLDVGVMVEGRVLRRA